MTAAPPHDAERGAGAVWRRRLGRPLRDHRAQALLLFLAVSWTVKFGGSTDIASPPYASAVSSDFSSFVWYFWHLKEALLGHRALLFSDQLFYPLGLHLIRQDWAPVPIQVSSFGLLAGDDSSVTVDGMERGLRRRGHNLVVIDSKTGQVREARSFDLVDNLAGTEGARLAAFLQSVPAGQIVCDSVRDDGSLNATDQVVAALRSIGALGRLRGRYRHSYAVVGVKGARPGTAVERVSKAPVHVRLDQALELQSVRIEPVSGT